MTVYDLINKLMINSNGDLNKKVVLVDTKDFDWVFDHFQVQADTQNDTVTIGRFDKNINGRAI